jgi:biopolymer transport protein ExbD
MAVRLISGDDDLEENHEINVTPFIDVILVLLIIFMVAAPLSTVDVNVDLPASTAEPAPRPDKPLFLTIKADLSLLLGEDPVGRDGLAGALDAAANSDREQRVFVRADRTVSYGDIMETMNLLRAAGYLKIGLVGLETGGAPAHGPSAAAPPPDVKAAAPRP